MVGVGTQNKGPKPLEGGVGERRKGGQEMRTLYFRTKKGGPGSCHLLNYLAPERTENSIFSNHFLALKLTTKRALKDRSEGGFLSGQRLGRKQSVLPRNQAASGRCAVWSRPTEALKLYHLGLFWLQMRETRRGELIDSCN